jgi:hypothetical protein
MLFAIELHNVVCNLKKCKWHILITKFDCKQFFFNEYIFLLNYTHFPTVFILFAPIVGIIMSIQGGWCYGKLNYMSLVIMGSWRLEKKLGVGKEVGDVRALCYFDITSHYL